MGALICSKISARQASLIMVVTALVFLYAFIFSDFGRSFQSIGLEATNSTGVVYHRAGLLSREEMSEIIKRRTKYTNRRLLLSGMETRDELKRTVQSLAANFRDLVTRRVGRSVVVYNRNRRFLVNNQCSNKDISIIQREEPNSGIPRYEVQIVNTCISDCAPTDIHLFCGWFASSPLVNPSYFKRLAYNDCLVNGGRPLPPGSVIQFQYANTFMYPLRFRSAKFC